MTSRRCFYLIKILRQGRVQNHEINKFPHGGASETFKMLFGHSQCT